MEGWQLGYRPELDGLRGCAVLAVIVAHARFDAFRHAGVVGVGVFFVLSGFLITALLLEEQRESGSVSLRAFWRRRAVRLLPALVVMIAAFTLVPLTPYRPSPGRLTSILLYVGNWFRGDGFVMEPFGHTWSLSVEEQFYVVWPLLVVLLWRRRGWLVGVLVVATVLSAVSRLVLWTPEIGYGPANQQVYAATHTNIFMMLAGCGLAMAVVSGRRVVVSRSVAVAAAVVLAGLGGGFAAAFPRADWARQFLSVTFGWSVLPVLTAVFTTAMLAYLVTTGAAWLRWAPLVAVGRVSYGIYLWHWPVFKAWEARFGPLHGEIGETLLLAGITTALAATSWRYAEQPIGRRWRTRRPVAARRAAAVPGA